MDIKLFFLHTGRPRSMDDLYFQNLWGEQITFSATYLAYPRPSIAMTFRKFSTAPEVSLSMTLWDIAIRPKNISVCFVTLKRDFLTSEQFGFYTVNVSNDQGYFAATLFIRPKGTRICNFKIQFLRTSKTFQTKKSTSPYMQQLVCFYMYAYVMHL